MSIAYHLLRFNEKTKKIYKYRKANIIDLQNKFKLLQNVLCGKFHYEVPKGKHNWLLVSFSLKCIPKKMKWLKNLYQLC
jgi:hypothetical protein